MLKKDDMKMFATGAVIFIALIAAFVFLNVKQNESTVRTWTIGEIVDVKDIANVLFYKELVIRVEEDQAIARLKITEDFYYLHSEELKNGACMRLEKIERPYELPSYAFVKFSPCVTVVIK